MTERDFWPEQGYSIIGPSKHELGAHGMVFQSKCYCCNELVELDSPNDVLCKTCHEKP